MCATVCPSGALFFGTHEELARERAGTPINEFVFGTRTIRTKVSLMMPAESTRLQVKIGATVRKTDLLSAVRPVERNPA